MRADDPTLSAKDAALRADDPTLSAKGAAMRADDPTLSAKGVALRADDPTLSAKDAALRAEGPLPSQPGATPQETESAPALRAESPAQRIAWKAVEKRQLLGEKHVVLATERFLGEAGAVSEEHPTTRLGDVAEYVRGLTYGKGDEAELPTPNAVLRAQNVSVAESRLVLDDLRYLRPDFEGSAEKRLRADDILVCSSSGSKAHMGKVAFVPSDLPYFFGGFMGVLRSRRELIEPRFLFRLLTSQHHKTFLAGLTEGANINNLKLTEYLEYEIPLPPLEEQRRIVEEIEGYQKVLDGARQILAGYKPRLETNVDWPVTTIGEVARVVSGHGFPLDQQGLTEGGIPFYKVSDMNLPGNERFMVSHNNAVSRETLAKLRAKAHPAGTIIFPKIGAAIATNKKRMLTCEATFDNNVMGIVPGAEIEPKFLFGWLMDFNLSQWASEAHPPSMRQPTVEEQEIPLPPLEEQRRLVAELDAEAAQMDAVRALLPRFEAKIQRVLDRVWGNLRRPRHERAR
jgi:restriction endonuclease S subunit